MVWPDQTRYEGQFKNGLIEGQGTKIFANGDRYVGTFKNDQMNGTGVWYSMADQTKRQGEWSNGKKVAWLSVPQQTHVSGYGDQ